MADKKADPSGVSTKVVRQTVSKSSIFVLLQIKFEEWNKTRANRRWSRKMAQAKAAKLMGIAPKPKLAPKPKVTSAVPSVPADPKKGRKGDRVVQALLLALLLLAALGLVLTAVWYFSQPTVAGTLPLVGSPTPNAVATAVPAAVSTETVYLRVETLQVDTTYGIWRRMSGVPILLSPFGEDGELRETLRQVTEEVTTVDGFLVAATTFEVPEGTYWVGVDEEGLPAGCAVWLPRLETDEENRIEFGSQPGWVAVRLDAYPGFNAQVVKIQIICGQEVSVSPATVVPASTPVPPTATQVPPTGTPPPTVTQVPPTVTQVPPTGTPPPTVTQVPPTATQVPPTGTPPPTVTQVPPTEVICNCETPSTPVPTPTAYPTWVPTPTPVR